MLSRLQWKVKLTMASLIPEDRMAFFCYTRYVLVSHLLDSTD